MNERTRGRGGRDHERRSRQGGSDVRDVAHDRGRRREGYRGSEERYTTDRDWSDEDRYQRDSDYGSRSGGGYGREDDDRWQRGGQYGGQFGAQYGGEFSGRSSSGMYGGRGPYGGPSQYGQGGYGTSYGGEYGDYGSSQFDRGGYQQGGSDEGQYGRPFGQSENWRGDYGRQFAGQGGYGGHQIGSGSRGQYAPDFGQSGQGQHGQYAQGPWGQSSSYGRGQYEYNRGTQDWNRGAQDWNRGGRGSWSESENFAGRGPKGYQRSDERLKEQVSDRLMDDPQIDASEITVEVQGGEVTLTGTVNSRDEKRAAEACAESVSGVREVINQLRVKRGDESSAQSRSVPGAQTGGSQSSRSTRGSTSERGET